MPAARVLAGRSIAIRLAASALFWSLLILLTAGLILSALYRDTTERAFDTRLLVYATDLASDLVTQGNPDQRELGTLGDPRFDLPLSGWYWQVGQPDARPRDLRSSRSLFGAELPGLVPPGDDSHFGEIRKGYRQGPEDRMLRLVERDIDLGEDGRYVVRVAGPADEIGAEVRRFIFSLTVTFGLLGIALGLTTLLQIRFGLGPLTKLRSALSAVRRGEAERIPGDYPRDIAPLAQELNLLLDTNREILDRARTQVGNLAHALKTPLSVITNEARATRGAFAEKVAEQSAIMSRQVNHYLDRARIAARSNVIGAVTEVEPVIARLVRAMNRIHEDRGLALRFDIPDKILFKGEQQDLEEIVGNLVDNACKWGRSTVTVTLGGRSEPNGDGPGSFTLDIDDDGPGLTAEERAEATRRGRRLDESKPGSGLGLSIVTDLVALYDGRFELDRSPAGGLRAEIELPAA
jgi:signal transduction histidine kinase